jgi:hypothetical protein
MNDKQKEEFEYLYKRTKLILDFIVEKSANKELLYPFQRILDEAYSFKKF